MCVTLISVDGACKEFASLARAAWRGDESSLERFIAAVERSQKYLESKEITLFAVWTCNLRTQDRKPRIGEGAEPCRTRTKRIERIRAVIRRADKDCSSRYRNGSSGCPPELSVIVFASTQWLFGIQLACADAEVKAKRINASGMRVSAMVVFSCTPH